MSDNDQDDIDKLLQDALVGGDGDPASPDDPAPELHGPASQDDIDALFAAVGTGETMPPPDSEALPDSTGDDGGFGDDIDALFAAVEESSGTPALTPNQDASATHVDIDAMFADSDVSKPASPSSPEDDIQEDLDTLFSAVDQFEPDPVDGDLSSRQADALFESELAAAEAAADNETGSGDSDLRELLSAIVEESGPPDDAPPEAGSAAAREARHNSTTIVDIDMDELLRQVAEAAPPPPQPKPVTMDAGDTAVLPPDVSTALAQAEDGDSDPRIPSDSNGLSDSGERAGPVSSMYSPSRPEISDSAPMPGARREYSVLFGAGEVESLSNQIGALLGSMSEKAKGYMQAWIAADSESKELRARALAEERRRASLESEKNALLGQLEEVRARLGDIESAKISGEESRRTMETTFQAKIRELESQVTLLGSEAASLKDELTRARNQATGVDIESRRARFEAERLKNEVESERMERLRIQRALENREKEIQAMQSQNSGQASSLFIDELHRLVRRLESELDARSSGAHDALKQLDRLDVSEAMVPVAANIRAALLQALGQDADGDDALKSLGREASGVKGPSAIAPAKAEMVSFESALSTYNLVGAVDVAGALLREASATPGTLMKKIYQCPALRRSEVGEHLGDVARLLEGLRTVQEANDRTRGSETAESEVFYVHMFDFLHNLVRLKLINRLSGDIWRIFLDLRGRFSFVTSDKQWAEYRDKTLNS